MILHQMKTPFAATNKKYPNSIISKKPLSCHL